MELQSSIRYLPLLVLLWLAARCDLRSRRVPNWISYSLILGGLLLSGMPWGFLPPGSALAGFGLGFALALVLYLLNGIGAGDVKLLAGTGAFLGPLPVLLIFAGAALVGMVLAIAQGARQGRLAALFRDGAMLGMSVAAGAPAGISAIPAARQDRSRTLPFAVAIAASATLFVVTRAVVRR